MSSRLPASVDDIDVRALMAALVRRARLLLSATLLVGVMTFGIFCLITPKYAAQVQIEIVSKGLGNPFETRRDASSWEMISVRMDKEAIGTHVRALQSSDLALKVAKQFDLAAKPEFNSVIAEQGLFGRPLNWIGLFAVRVGQTDEERVLRAFSEALRVYQLKDTRGIIIEFKSQEPQLAAAIANRLAELYRDDLALRAVQETEDARAKLGPQIRKLAGEVAEAEAHVTRFRGQANIFEAGRERSGLNEQQLSELTAELTKAATVKAEAQARAKEARGVAARGGGETLADVQKSPLVPRLVEQRVRVERQLAELSVTLLPAHPRMKQLQADLAGLNKQIKAEVGKVVEGLEREVKVASLREDSMRQRIEEAKWRVVSAGADDVTLRALESLAKSKRSEFERLQTQLEAARTTADARAVPVEVQIISRARPSSEPISPKPTLVAALAAFATGLLGVALLITRELLGDWPAAKRDKIELVGPRLRRAASRPGRFASVPSRPARWSPPPAFPTISSIARHLISEARGNMGFLTVVAGAGAATCPEQAATDLARQLARQGRQAILLNFAPSGKGLTGELELEPALGFTDVLLGRAACADVVRQLANSTAHVIVARSSAEGAAVITDKDRVNMLLDGLAEAYDHIVIAGAYDAVRDLFVTIEGSIDAGVVVAGSEGSERNGYFLGFDAADLKLIHYEPTRARQRAVMLAPAAVAAS